MKYKLEQDRIEMLSILVAFEKSNGTADDVANLMGISKRALFFRLKRLRLSMRKLHNLKRGRPMASADHTESFDAQCDGNNCGDEYPVTVNFDLDIDAGVIITVDICEYETLRCPTCHKVMDTDNENKWLEDVKKKIKLYYAQPTASDIEDMKADAAYDERMGK